MAREASSNQGGPDVRDGILATASDLFYQHGIRAVGVDLVVEKVGVAKTSLYRHSSTAHLLARRCTNQERRPRCCSERRPP
jgi:hypothetical protein